MPLRDDEIENGDSAAIAGKGLQDCFYHPEFRMAKAVRLFVGPTVPYAGKIRGHVVEASE
jgi:hypothetical protein